MYNFKVDECGPVHINVGDGGNYEGTYVPWLDPVPEWTVFRESSFGVASLDFLSPTTANFSWHRHACQSNVTADHIDFNQNCVSPGDNSAQRMLTSDSFIMTKPSRASCPNRWVSTATDEKVVNSPTAAPTSDNDDDCDDNQAIIIGLSVATGVFGLSTLVLSFFIFRSLRVKPPMSTMSAGINNV